MIDIASKNVKSIFIGNPSGESDARRVLGVFLGDQQLFPIGKRSIREDDDGIVDENMPKYRFDDQTWEQMMAHIHSIDNKRERVAEPEEPIVNPEVQGKISQLADILFPGQE